MKQLYEESNYLSSPVEAFLYDSELYPFPIQTHWHYYSELLFFIEGTGLVRKNSIETPVKAGDLVYLHPTALHSIHGDVHLKYYVIKYNPELFRLSGSHAPQFFQIFSSVKENTSLPFVFHSEDLFSFSPECFFKECISELNKKDYGYDTCINSCLSEILIHILRFWHRNGYQFSNPSLVTDKKNLFFITKYISEHIDDPLKVEELAAMCSMSYSYFAKKFSELFGKSCKNYIESLRISQVRDLLRFTDYDLNYIAMETGFSDCSHLIRAFKKHESTTPKQYRLHYQRKK